MLHVAQYRSITSASAPLLHLLLHLPTPISNPISNAVSKSLTISSKNRAWRKQLSTKLVVAAFRTPRRPRQQNLLLLLSCCISSATLRRFTTSRQTEGGCGILPNNKALSSSSIEWTTSTPHNRLDPLRDGATPFAFATLPRATKQSRGQQQMIWRLQRQRKGESTPNDDAATQNNRR